MLGDQGEEVAVPLFKANIFRVTFDDEGAENLSVDLEWDAEPVVRAWAGQHKGAALEHLP